MTVKELKGFYLTLFGWVVLALVTVMQGVSLSMAMKGLRTTPVKDGLVHVVFNTQLFWFYFLFIFPLITMRLFAEEEKAGTLEPMLTAPVRTWQVVMAKYLAAMVFYVLMWIPCVLQFKVFEWVVGSQAEWAAAQAQAWHWGALGGALAIVILMGAAFTALGCLCSSLTSNQLIAGLLTVGLLMLNYFLGFVTVIWGDSFPGAAIFHYISPQEHLYYFTRGLLDTRPAVYYLSMAVLLLFLTYQAVDYRRWRK